MSPEEKKANRLKTYILLGSMPDVEILDCVEPYEPIIRGNSASDIVDYTLVWRKNEPNLILCFNADFCKVNRVIYYDKENNVIYYFSYVSDIVDLDINSYTYEALWNFADHKKGMSILNAYVVGKDYPQLVYYEDSNGYNLSIYNAINIFSKGKRLNGDLLVMPITKFMLNKFWEG